MQQMGVAHECLRRCAAMLGYPVEALLGTEFMGYCVPEDRDRIVDLYARRAGEEPARRSMP